MKKYRCVEGFVNDGPHARIVAVGTREAAEAWAVSVDLDVLQWTDFYDYPQAYKRAMDFVESPYVRFQPVDGDRETLDVFWLGRLPTSLDKTEPLVQKVLGPLFV
jgi:hypothetical protein